LARELPEHGRQPLGRERERALALLLEVRLALELGLRELERVPNSRALPVSDEPAGEERDGRNGGRGPERNGARQGHPVQSLTTERRQCELQVARAAQHVVRAPRVDVV